MPFNPMRQMSRQSSPLPEHSEVASPIIGRFLDELERATHLVPDPRMRQIRRMVLPQLRVDLAAMPHDVAQALVLALREAINRIEGDDGAVTQADSAQTGGEGAIDRGEPVGQVSSD